MLTLILLACMQLPTSDDMTLNFSLVHTEPSCQEGLSINIVGKDGKPDEIAKCVNGYYERVPRAADETDGKQPKAKICKVRQVYKQGDVEDVTLSCIPDILAEPVDVPAVKIGKRQVCDSMLANGVPLPYCWYETKYTCADKTRVLWHDESNPAHWWCHRVQSQ